MNKLDNKQTTYNLVEEFGKLERELVDPLLEAGGFPREVALAFKQKLSEVILNQALLAATQALTQEEKKQLESKLQKEKEQKKQFEILFQILKNSPQSQEEIRNYLENDFPKLIQELLIDKFAKQATPSQKQKFLALVKPFLSQSSQSNFHLRGGNR